MHAASDGLPCLSQLGSLKVWAAVGAVEAY